MIIFYFFAVALTVLSCLYFYFVGNMVYNASKRVEIERRIASLEGSIGDLEVFVTNQKATITIELARAKGFKDISKTTYISRKPLGQQLSLINEI